MLRRLAAGALLVAVTSLSVPALANPVRSFAPVTLPGGGISSWFNTVGTSLATVDPVVVRGSLLRLWYRTYLYAPFWTFSDGAPFAFTATALRFSTASGTVVQAPIEQAPRVTVAAVVPAAPAPSQQVETVPVTPAQTPEAEEAPEATPPTAPEQPAQPEPKYDLLWWYIALNRHRIPAPPDAQEEHGGSTVQTPEQSAPAPAPPRPAPRQPEPARPAPAPPEEQPAPQQPAPPAEQPVQGLTAAEQEMLNLVNAERAKAGLPALKADLKLTQVARLKSQDMIANSYFSHQSPTYGSPFDMMRRFGITYRTAAENIAGNQSVARAHTALMNSSGHRANILGRNFTHIGIGIVSGGRYGMMFTQMFRG